jgi:hypothetical protein
MRRFVAVGAAVATLGGNAGCTPPATVVPGARPITISVRSHYAEVAHAYRPRQRCLPGEPTWDGMLGDEFEKRNLHLVKSPEASLHAEIEFGVPRDTRVADLYLVREGQRVCVARIRTPFRPVGPSFIMAEWVAELLAREIVSPHASSEGDACGT